MEYQTHKNPKFLGKLPRQESIVTDNTMMLQFKFCPRSYFYRMVVGYKPNEEAPYFPWGSAMHKFAEIYVGGIKKQAGEIVLSQDQDGVYKVKPFNFNVSVAESLRIWTKAYPKDMPAGSSKWDFMTSARLMRSLMKLRDDIDSDVKSGKFEYLAVEQFFDLELPSGRRYGGRADRMQRWNGRPWGWDLKTTSKELTYYERKLNPNFQMSGYTWAEEKLFGEMVFGQMVTVIFNKAPTKQLTSEDKIGPVLKTFLATRTKDDIDLFVNDTEQWLNYIDECREKDNWIQNDKNCAFCKYHLVCSASNDDSRVDLLVNKYIYSPWDHTKVEQDD